ncbi:MAG: Asp-tRNA(Asn)/Glu-tRNA(Gln) amidotransferase subunit GatA [candidate division Zixibacteria bacterium]|nr:Asp-tRNA(Asn)/Glu-tRNA(Gln) amidotransferase subunit GatA [candidate division Zixibacteria bacterium]
MENVAQLTARQIGELITSGHYSAREVLEAFLDRIKEINARTNAILHFTEELAYRQTEAIDKSIRSGDKLPPYAGVPAIIKDNMNLEGYPCTCGSKILENYISPYTAGAVEKMMNAGLVILGKSNMDEFGMGSSNEFSAYGRVANPHSAEHVPGGSSGGSASVAADRMAPFVLGSDTGGSVRQPSAYCGVVGMRPTYGLVSRFGLVAFASSMDQIGPMTSNVTDNAVLLAIIAGYDQKDSTSVNRETPEYASFLDNSIEGKKVGLPVEYFGDGLDEEIQSAVLRCVEILKDEGAVVDEISLPNSAICIADYYLIANAEASSNLARYDGVRYGYSKRSGDLDDDFIRTRSEGFGPEVKRRIMLGTYALSAGYFDKYYRRAGKVRAGIKAEMDAAFSRCDILLTPTTPAPAFRFGEKVDDPLSMYLSDIYLSAASLAGIPALSLPCGNNPEGLPLGVQLMGRPMEEGLIYNFARTLEKNLGYGE